LALAGGGEVLAARVEGGPCLVAGLDGLGEADLVVLGEQRVLPDVGEVEADEVFFVALHALLRQNRLLGSLDRRRTTPGGTRDPTKRSQVTGAVKRTNPGDRRGCGAPEGT